MILSTKHESGSIQHIEIYKKPDGFKMKGQPRFYSSLEMLILSLRKEGKKGDEDDHASEESAPKKSPRPERFAGGRPRRRPYRRRPNRAAPRRQ